MSKHGLTRRQVLELGVGYGAAAAFPEAAMAAAKHAAKRPHVHLRGTTLERTILTGRVINAGGYCHLRYGPGEPHVVRHDLGVRGSERRAARGRALASLAQFTDVHVQDSQSPARVEFLDRLSDGANANDVWTTSGAALDLFGASYHPPEMLTA